MSAAAVTAAQAGLVSCEICGLLSRPVAAEEPGHCPRCGAELAIRHHHSIQYTWALVIAAAICYVPANLFPVLTTTALRSKESDTIMGGVLLLYTTGSWPLALIVLIEVQSFVSTPGEAAALDAVWTVRRVKGGTTESGRATVREAVQESNYEALAAAHSRALGRLSRDIANAVRPLERAVR